jgi:hypothetical protein
MRLLTYFVTMDYNDVPFCRDVDVVDVCFICLYIAILRVKVSNIKVLATQAC